MKATKTKAKKGKRETSEKYKEVGGEGGSKRILHPV